MSPITNDVSKLAPYILALPVELHWDILEQIIFNLFGTDEPLAWAKAASWLLCLNPKLTERLLVAIHKLHRAIYWELEALWPKMKGGCDVASAKHAYLSERDQGLVTILEAVGASEDWGFIHQTDRSLTGYTFGVGSFITAPANAARAKAAVPEL